MKILRYISALVFILISLKGFTQITFTGRAYEEYNAKNYDAARELIDSAITTNERYDSQTWQLRGIIYRNLETPELSYYREISIESFVQAKNVDTTDIYTEKINQYIENTIIRYYNDAVRFMNEKHDLEKSLEAYELYREQYFRLLDPKHNFNQSDVDYYNALGAEYLTKISTVPPEKQEDVRVRAIEQCNKVTDIDSLNYQANFNAGIIYYNYGAELITTLNPLGGIEELMQNQQKSEKQFLKALPYLHRAEKINPGSVEVIIALMSCYYGLNNNEKYIHYQTIYDKMVIDKLEQRFANNPNDLETAEELLRIYKTTIINETKAAEIKAKIDELKK
jgi:tetratricopeptide (TPR) repeat protein